MVEPALHQGRGPRLEWAVCATAYPGQQRSGDGFLVETTGNGTLVAVVDALGHGEEAGDVADRALVSLRATAGLPLTASLSACHRALCGSRGAVMTLIAVDPGSSTLTWVAVGNVEAAVLQRGRGPGGGDRWSVPQRGGVVGGRLPPLQESAAPLRPGDVLVAATDGLGTAFLDGADPRRPPAELARRLHADHAGGHDDALVLVARSLPPA